MNNKGVSLGITPLFINEERIFKIWIINYQKVTLS